MKKPSAVQAMFQPMFRPTVMGMTEAGLGGPVTPFDPLTIPSLRVWIDPDDSATKFQDAAGTTPVTALGQSVGRITDKSGNGNHFTQATGGLEPVNSTLGDVQIDRGALSFNGTSQLTRCDELAALMLGTGPQWTIHIVFSQTPTSLVRAVFAAGSTSSTVHSAWLQGRSAGSLVSLETRRGGLPVTAPCGASTTGSQVVSIRHNGTTIDAWRNGVRTATAVPVAVQSSSVINTFALGAFVRATTGSYHIGKIGEFLMSAAANSDAEVTRAHNYLIGRLVSDKPVMDVFIVTGQSNAEGRGTSGPTVPAGTAIYVTNGAITDLADPVGGAATGSAWPSFANQWKSVTGRSSAWVESATGGSGLIDGVGTTNWSPSGTLRSAAVAAANSAIASVRDSLQYQLGNVYLCWQQGEQDATEYNGTTISASTYQPAQEELFDYFFANINSLGAILVSELGEHVTPNPNYALIRGAQNAAVAATPNCHLVFTGAKNFPAEGKMKADGVHYDQAGLDQMGAGMATGAAAVV